MTQMPAKRKPRVTDNSLSTIEQVKKQVAKDIAKGPSKTHQLIINLTAEGMEGLTYASRRYRTTKSHIADLVFSNLHKLRLVDIVDDTDTTPTQESDDNEPDTTEDETDTE